MKDNSFILFVLIFILIVTTFFGALGMGFHGKIEKPDVKQGEAPGIWDVIKWCWNGITFIFGMMLFQVDNVPAWQNMIFIIIGLLLLWIIVKWIRGYNAGV